MAQQPTGRNLELEALIASATVELGSAQRSFLSRLSREDFDWNLFFRLACNHRLIGVVSHHLRNGVYCQVPESIRNEFAASSRSQGRNNLWLTKALLELLASFESAGIPAIAYKGPVLSEQLYADLGMRASTDLDLIVRSQDLRRTRDCLAEMGFEDGYCLERSQQEVAFRFGFEHSFTRSGIWLDLHWRLAPRWITRSVDMDSIFCRASQRPFLGTGCLCLSDEDLFIALCIHAAQHDWGQLSQFADIVESLRRPPQLDWDLIRYQMSDPQLERTVLVSLEIVRTHWTVKLPPWCDEAIERRSTVADLAALSKRGWMSSVWPSHTRLGLFEKVCGETLSDRLAILVGIVFEPKIPDFRALQLPPRLSWLYWFTRPVRLLWKRLWFSSPANAE